MRIATTRENAAPQNASFENSLNAALESQNMPHHSRHAHQRRGQPSSNATRSAPSTRHSPAHRVNAWQAYTQQQDPASLMMEGASLAKSYIPNLDEGDHVLDIGTGAGFFPLELAQAAQDDGIRITITGVDIMPNSFFNAARQSYSPSIRNMVSYRQSPIESFAFNRQYNAINADGVLPYLPAAQQLRTAAQIANALAPQGNGVIQVTRDTEGTSSSGQPTYALSENEFDAMVSDLQMRGVLPENTSGSIDQNGAFTTIYLYNPQES